MPQLATRGRKIGSTEDKNTAFQTTKPLEGGQLPRRILGCKNTHPSRCSPQRPQCDIPAGLVYTHQRLERARVRTLDADDFSKAVHRRESLTVFAGLCIPLLSYKGLLLPFSLQHLPGGSGASAFPRQSQPRADVNELQKIRTQVKSRSIRAETYSRSSNLQFSCRGLPACWDCTGQKSLPPMLHSRRDTCGASHASLRLRLLEP